MKKIIDLHTHLDTLDDVFQFRTKIQSHLNRTQDHIKKNHKVILSVAMYVQIYQDYDSLVQLIKKFKEEISSLKETKLILNSADLDEEFKVGILLHVESGRVLENADVQLAELYSLGVRGIIPIHFKDNLVGTSCDDPLRRTGIKKSDQGLTEYGRGFIKKCNELKMWIDVTHTTDATASEILELGNFVMVSHIGIRDLVDRKRNKSIEFYKKLTSKGGLVGITAWCHLIGPDQDSLIKTYRFGLENELGESLCIGTDFGAPIKTHGSIKSIFDIANILDELPDSAENIQWNNAYRFFKEAL
jgi:membrane dipeptidase